MFPHCRQHTQNFNITFTLALNSIFHNNNNNNDNHTEQLTEVNRSPWKSKEEALYRKRRYISLERIIVYSLYWLKCTLKHISLFLLLSRSPQYTRRLLSVTLTSTFSLSHPIFVAFLTQIWLNTWRTWFWDVFFIRFLIYLFFSMTFVVVGPCLLYSTQHLK